MFSYAITVETEENIVLAGEHICIGLSRFPYVTVGYNQEYYFKMATIRCILFLSYTTCLPR
jgi:hypothetical protein